MGLHSLQFSSKHPTLLLVARLSQGWLSLVFWSAEFANVNYAEGSDLGPVIWGAGVLSPASACLRSPYTQQLSVRVALL
jgi:hypothetical protein